MNVTEGSEEPIVNRPMESKGPAVSRPNVTAGPGVWCLECDHGVEEAHLESTEGDLRARGILL